MGKNLLRDKGKLSIELHILLLCAEKRERRGSDRGRRDAGGVRWAGSPRAARTGPPSQRSLAPLQGFQLPQFSLSQLELSC